MKLADFVSAGEFNKNELVCRCIEASGAYLLHVAAAKNLPLCVHALIKAGAAVDRIDDSGATPLLWAARQGASETCVALLTAGADPSLANYAGYLPLHEALLHGHYATAFAMLATSKVNVNIRLRNDNSALASMLLVKKDDDLDACCRVLCPFLPDINIYTFAKDKFGPESVLDICARLHLNRSSAFSLIVNIRPLIPVKSSVLNATDKNNATLFYRALQAGNYEAARGLVLSGADTSIAPFVKRKAKVDSALQLCVKLGHLDIAVAMLHAVRESGRNDHLAEILNSPDTVFGIPPVLSASIRRDPLEVREWIKLFIQFGAKLESMQLRMPQKPSKKLAIEGVRGGESLLMELIKRGHVDAAQCLMDVFETKGPITPAMYNEYDSESSSLVFYSVWRCRNYDRNNILKRLMHHGADPSTSNSNGVTPLIAACRANNTIACMILLNHDCNYGIPQFEWHKQEDQLPIRDLDAVDNLNNTALFYAVLHENLLMVHMLLRAGADPDVQKRKDKMTCLQLAIRVRERGNTDLFTMLLGLGESDPLLKDKKGNTALDYAYMEELVFFHRPMSKYFKDKYGKEYHTLLREEIRHLRREEKRCQDSPNQGWGTPMNSTISIITTAAKKFASIYSAASNNDEDNDVLKAYKVCYDRIPPLRTVVSMRAKAVYEYDLGHQLIMEANESQLKAKAFQLGVFAAKVGASYLESSGILASAIDFGASLIDSALNSDTLDVLQECWSVYKQSKDYLDQFEHISDSLKHLLKNDGDDGIEEGEGRDDGDSDDKVGKSNKGRDDGDSNGEEGKSNKGSDDGDCDDSADSDLSLNIGGKRYKNAGGLFQGVLKFHDPMYDQSLPIFALSKIAPKEMPTPKASDKQKPNRLRVGEAVRLGESGIQGIVVRDYGKVPLPFLAFYHKVMEDEKEQTKSSVSTAGSPMLSLVFERWEQSPFGLQSLDFPPQDRAVKGRAMLSLAYNGSEEILIVRLIQAENIKMSKNRLYLEATIENGEIPKIGKGAPVWKLSTKVVKDGREWNEGEGTLVFHQVEWLDLLRSKLRIDMFDKRTGFIGGALVSLRSIGFNDAQKEDKFGVEELWVRLSQEYRQDAKAAGADSLDVTKEPVSSVYGFSPIFHQALADKIDNGVSHGLPTLGAVEERGLMLGLLSPLKVLWNSVSTKTSVDKLL